ncbi:hypothetical protein JHD48_00480 [Sulfurimonas sp. SAG-AH-194-I05]|nr:hypothetical protein [Sulfurimonas sp. SAG-AH-194-I05]MDF1874202.1 hypothetical protein [Sulfurimonas sp. SAG-AH-194-I05]
MQRKNDLLKPMRKGIAMIMALIVIVAIASIMALGLSLSTQTTKRSIDLYTHEQSILLSKSAAEYALLRISQDNNTTNPCNITTLNFKQDYYDINISILYIYENPPASCAGKMYASSITTDEQNGSVLMDITVSVDDISITTEPIRYFRRSIQKL